MDFVYICRSGTNEELRYSIRSVEKHFPDSKIWVVGYKPYWYSGNFLPVKDSTVKYENIRLAILAITSCKEISNNFVLMNDDFFIINPIKKIPTYYGGSFEDKVLRYQSINALNGYTRLLRSTLLFMQKQRLNLLDYDLHVPMVFNKKKLKPIASIPNVCTRTLYGNTYNIGGKLINDVKVYPSGSIYQTLENGISKDFYFISSDDDSFDNLYNDILKDMFNTPSRFECPQ